MYFLVGPAGLMNMLSFVRFQINEDKRAENSWQILTVFAGLADKVGGSIQSLVNNFDKFSGSFNKNLLPKTRNIANLGIEIDIILGVTQCLYSKIVNHQLIRYV